MADIAMCEDRQCPSRGHCHRYCAVPNEHRQAYAGYKHEGTKCLAFAERWPRDRLGDEVDRQIDDWERKQNAG